jgi:hypothetical protein
VRPETLTRRLTLTNEQVEEMSNVEKVCTLGPGAEQEVTMAKKDVGALSEVEKAYMLGFVDMALVSEAGLKALMRVRRQIPDLARLLSRAGVKDMERVVGSEGLASLRDVRFDVDV